MKCNNCGKSVPADSGFCPYCGSAIESKSDKKENKNQKPDELFVSSNDKSGTKRFINKYSIIVSSAVIVLIVIVCVAVYFNERTYSTSSAPKTVATEQDKDYDEEDYYDDEDFYNDEDYDDNEYNYDEDYYDEDYYTERTSLTTRRYTTRATTTAKRTTTTTTKRTTTTTKATTSAAFKTLSYSGSGVDSVTRINVPEGNYYIICAYSGEHNFTAYLYPDSSSGSYNRLMIANIVGDGKTVAGYSGTIKNGYIDVTDATGDWTITIEKCQPKNSGTSLKYSGSGITGIKNINLPAGDYYVKCTYNGEHNFTAYFFSDVSSNLYGGNMIANMVGPGTATATVSGPIENGYISIKDASGSWTITIEPC